MTWLTLWLKKIILLVLLAAFLDLILPNTTLQRYVKMVMGLILLLTIISPVFSLFSLSQDDLALRLDRYQQELNKPASVEWKKMTDKLLGQQNEQMTAYVQAQVAAAVKAKIKADYGVEVADVAVVIEQKQQGEPTLSRMELVIGEADSAPDQNGLQQVQPIKPITPIAPVEVTIGEAQEPKQEVEVAAREDNPLMSRMASDLAAQWGLSKEQVIIKDESREREKQ
ncbi:stage III sporulation protein AF [Brevibacillus agri]|uniref:stage III sporulation protein AF n=1 Tax=Brevibacillus TaxID=55080 RepID=UPI000403E111|nr:MULTISPECIES: stage III sporulation protein AF [Brevibacillus]MDN4091552.1 stage III sporulation protein AF [Brevibacillus agri]MDR9503232.1 stage III sporulation protein AF [Brevibacillus agri]QHZ57053.1 stage III sporulation protein AF [Brevibacillus sp. NSP2.1]